MSNFGSRVKELRLQQRMTQRQLAKNMNVTPAYISKIENHQFEVLPSEDVITRLAQHLHADAEELLILAGKIDKDALQERASKSQPTAVLLRRIQKGMITEEAIARFNQDTED